jgi:hypothetical protein
MMIPIFSPPPDKYLTLIGRFIVSMSYVEAYLKQALWQATNIGEELGALAWGGASLGAVNSLLKEWFDRHSKNQLVVDDLENIIAEASSLKEIRDQMAHRQWIANVESPSSFDMGDWDKLAKVKLSHKLLAKSAKLVEETPYSTTDLEKLCTRIRILTGRIMVFLLREQPKEATLALMQVIETNWRISLPTPPWLGKSAPRASVADKKQIARKPSPASLIALLIGIAPPCTARSQRCHAFGSSSISKSAGFFAMPPNLPPKPETLHFQKLDVARSQLKTAIQLWFYDGDPVSIHTLAYAAYEIIHFVSKKRNRTKELIFDTLSIKEEYRSKWAITIKKHANFFKHANNDADDSIDFNPTLSMMFIMGAAAGLRTIESGPPGNEESAFALWIILHRPTWAAAQVRERLKNRVPVEDLTYFQTLPKAQFFEAFMIAKRG